MKKIYYLSISIAIAIIGTCFIKVNNDKILNNCKINLFNNKTTAASISKSNNVEWYARILDKDIYLYRTPIDTIEDNVYFIIEPTYFVKLTASYDSIFYKAEYLDISGYVKKTEVQVVQSPPNQPFLENINFRIYGERSQQMRSTPNSNAGSSSQVCYLPYLSKDAIYYGKIYGESVIEGRTNIWYFCKYTSSKSYYGYIYSDGCDQLTPYEINDEECVYIDFPDFAKRNETTELSIIDPTSKNYGIIIGLICVPVGIFLIMIIKSQVILRLNKKEKSKEVKMFFDS